MKKKIFSVIVVTLVLATLFAGCTGILELNADRDSSQIVATVNVGELKGVVTKGDIISYYNQVGYTYIQYYGWDSEKIVTEFTKSMAKREILLLNAVKTFAEEYDLDLAKITKANNEYIDNLAKKGYKTYLEDKFQYDFFDMLDPDEQLYVIKAAKRSFKSSYDTILEEVKAEIEANTATPEEDEDEEDTEEEDKKTLEPRTQRTVTADTSFKKDASITSETVSAEKTFFEEMDADTANFTKAEKEAYNRLKKNILKNYSSVEVAWRVILDSQKESRLLEKYKEFINKDISVSEEELTSRYNFTLTNNMLTVYDEDTYKTAVEGDSSQDLLYHKEKNGYFTVKSILLKFSEDQENALKAIKAGVLGDTDNNQAISDNRSDLALDKNFSMPGFKSDIGGIKVNVSNPDYDPDATCIDNDCECVACQNGAKYIKNAVCENKDCECVACVNSAYSEYDVEYERILGDLSNAVADAKNVNFAANFEGNKDAAIANARVDAFDDYIYLVNDDPGMFNASGYTINMEGTSSYVVEYVVLARELAKRAMANNSLGVMGGVSAGKYANPFDNTLPDVEIYSYDSGNGEPVNYIVNDFGIHVIMVTYVACEDTDKVVGNEDDGYRLTLDYVTSYKNVYKTDDDGKVVLDENGKKTVIELTNKTVREKLSDKILEEKESANYSAKEKEITEENDSQKIVVNEKLQKKIIKEIEKQLKKAGIA